MRLCVYVRETTRKRMEIYVNILASRDTIRMLTAWSWVLLEKPPAVQLHKTSPIFYWTPRYITAFTGALHWSLSWARSIQCIPPHTITLRYSLTLFTQLRLHLPSGLFPSSFPTYMHSSSPHSCYMPCPSHLPCLGHSNYTWRRVQVMKFLII
jgi:hypothetical protein